MKVLGHHQGALGTHGEVTAWPSDSKLDRHSERSLAKVGGNKKKNKVVLLTESEHVKQGRRD